MTAFQGDKELGPIAPAKWFYNKRAEEPTTEVAIRRSFAYDLYVVLAGFDAEQQSATFHVVVNPLVNWIWAGFGILAIGTLIALLPERALAVASVKVPAGTASGTTTTTLLLVAAAGRPRSRTRARAAHRGRRRRSIVPRSPLERGVGRTRSSARAARAAGSASRSAPAARPSRCASSSRALVKKG